jgi:hypothetical protein
VVSLTTANEAAQAKTPLGSALEAGVENISYSQEITFNLYVRKILPLDGYVFWVNATLLPLDTTWPPLQIKAKGSLHYRTDTHQEEAASVAVNEVIFTSLQEVQDLNAVDAQLVYIASFQEIRFAFTTRRPFYQQAGLWHYVGNAIFSTMQSQIIDDLTKLPADTDLIVSNSLPGWLALNTRTVPWLPYWETPRLSLFPSYLNPDNLPPVYGAVHIEPDDTEAAQSVAYLDSRYNRWQLARDKVRITLYGCDNQLVSDFLDMVIDYMDTEAPFGLMNMPIIQDGKKIQSELLIIAEEKCIEFTVSYNQQAMRDMARQLIEHAIVTYIPQDWS